jgi:hypothetical protein
LTADLQAHHPCSTTSLRLNKVFFALTRLTKAQETNR